MWLSEKNIDLKRTKNDITIKISLRGNGGSSINDVTALGWGYQRFCDDSNEALVLKSVIIEGGVSCFFEN